jgi:hypothetical protein
MGFSSIDDLVNEMTGGKFWRIDWNKITGGSAYTAGRWYDMSILGGYPIANPYTGTALTSTQLTDASTGAMWHGGNVSTDTKHIVNGGVWSAVSTAVPGVWLICDFLLFYPGINMNVNTLQTLTNSAGLPRYTDGKGVRAFLVVTTATGGTAHNLSMSYTNQGGTSGETLPVTVACTASAIVGHITHSGTAANNYGPFLPLASGDYGIRSVQSVQLSAASGAGVACLVLARPLCAIPIVSASVSAERDFLNQLPSLPKVYDGAFIGLLFFAGAALAASSNIYGYLEMAWG